jgi:chromosome segregation protein
MTDVIFNGSTSRRSLGLAEVSLTFDNRRRALATQADEVQITRRVYRSGEGEYLINGQACRLKDIKDLFLGSGAGADAYCIIEQGRVDVLLQARALDRRSIFEEAAGISRFKARKTETLRRLERVDADLVRLRDILDELEKQLRSLTHQAARAQRHLEYSARLKELRVALGLREYHEARGKLDEESATLAALRGALDQESLESRDREEELRRLEGALAHLDASIRAQEAALAEARLQIAGEEATQARQRAALNEVEHDLAGTRLRLVGLMRHVGALAASCAAAFAELRQAEQKCADHRASAEASEAELRSTEKRLAELHRLVEQGRAEHVECMRQAGRLHNDAVQLKGQLDTLQRERSRLQLRSEQVAGHLVALDVELEQLTAADETLQRRLAAAREGLAELRAEGDRLAQQGTATTQQLADLRAQRSGLVSRIEVLQGLERSHEGLGTGPREVFALLEGAESGDWHTVLGLLAEHLTVRREYAPLIDLALGERAQRFLAWEAARVVRALGQLARRFTGRVSFLPLDTLPQCGMRDAECGMEGNSAFRIPHSALGGNVALASEVVRCEDPRLAGLPARLLGDTLIVRDLPAAREIAATQPGFRFVTLEGELLEADGTLTVGTYQPEAGILSRKSELRELRERVGALDLHLAGLERELADLRERIALHRTRVEHEEAEIDVLAEQAGDMRWRVGQHQQKRAGLSEDLTLSRHELSTLEADISRLRSEWQQALDQHNQAEERVRQVRQGLDEAEREIRMREGEREQQRQQAVQARINLAQAEERLAGLYARHHQLQADHARQMGECDQAGARLGALQKRCTECLATLLGSSAVLALAYLGKETAERRLREWACERSAVVQHRQVRLDQAEASRATWQQRHELAHARALAVQDLHHKLDGLCSRLREDYQVELAQLYEAHLATRPGEVPPLPAPPEGVEGHLPPEEEIAELRRKLSKLGSVNLDAIGELAGLEARHGSLKVQFDDLVAGQRHCQEIIEEVNRESRRLFAETFATIRTHFQELFRKLFGGGMADVVLEDGVDVLDSGIEVIARPPGKELRSISLMSGGEKTMTAVALLLAIFRSKPSPFCILDEVDAALDEANVGRFTLALKDFLEHSQFIIVTHRKRTMAEADVLYGVTMQESGVSKRMSMRFEDYWPEDEQPARAA